MLTPVMLRVVLTARLAKIDEFAFAKIGVAFIVRFVIFRYVLLARTLNIIDMLVLTVFTAPVQLKFL